MNDAAVIEHDLLEAAVVRGVALPARHLSDREPDDRADAHAARQRLRLPMARPSDGGQARTASANSSGTDSLEAATAESRRTRRRPKIREYATNGECASRSSSTGRPGASSRADDPHAATLPPGARTPPDGAASASRHASNSSLLLLRRNSRPRGGRATRQLALQIRMTCSFVNDVASAASSAGRASSQASDVRGGLRAAARSLDEMLFHSVFRNP